MVDIIAAKRDGGELTRHELGEVVSGFVAGAIPDYQMSAFLMAVLCRGFTPAELISFTEAMADSGIRLAWPQPVLDKHSTGGVGDKVTLILAPLLASVGLPVVKMSGRGLGHTGGTIDKLEAIPGLRTDFLPQELPVIVARSGVAVFGQGPELCPADGLIYSLRDVTGTVESSDLIAASVMSKKVVGGASWLILDVKVGQAALMKERSKALGLVRRLLLLANHFGLPTTAVLSRMDEPLGRAVGNSLEVWEAVETLSNRGPAALVAEVLALGTEALVLSGRAETRADARRRLRRALWDGSALSYFHRWVVAQGGDIGALERSETLIPGRSFPLRANRTGIVQYWDGLEVGLIASELGAGRERKGDPVDPAAGVLLRKIAGERVEAGEVLAEAFTSREDRLPDALARLGRAVRIGEGPPPRRRLILGVYGHEWLKENPLG